MSVVVYSIPTFQKFQATKTEDGKWELENEGRKFLITDQVFSTLYESEENHLARKQQILDHEAGLKMRKFKRREKLKKISDAPKREHLTTRKLKQRDEANYEDRTCDYVMEGMDSVSRFGTFERPPSEERNSLANSDWQIGQEKKRRKIKYVKIPRW